jgi:putative ABC transport system permease protein
MDRDAVLLVNVDMTRASIAPERRASVYANVRQSLLALPDVANAAFSMVTPAGGMGLVGRVSVIGGAPLPDDGPGYNAFSNVVSAGWFGTFGAPIVAGRDFSDQDRLGSPSVAIINQTLARHALGQENPIGRSIVLTIPGREMTMTIVGVAADTIYSSLRETVPSTLFTPITQPYFSQALLSSMTVGVRSKTGKADTISRSVADAMRQVNPDLALTFRPLRAQLDASVVNEKVTAAVAGFLGVLAVVLAALGLYGTTRYSVTQQRAEIGIRLAIGAAPGDIVRLVMARTGYVIGAGVVIGVVATLWMSPLVQPLLFGIEARDVRTIAGAAATLAAITAIAALLPARRASSADPAEVLRHL